MIGPLFESTDGRLFRLTLQGTLVPAGAAAEQRLAARRAAPSPPTGPIERLDRDRHVLTEADWLDPGRARRQTEGG